MHVVNLIHIYFIGVTEGDIQVALREKEAQLVKDGIDAPWAGQHAQICADSDAEVQF